MDSALEAMRRLYQLADYDRPPPPGLYVRSKRSVADDIVGDILVAPGVVTKHLLYGARGGGKSSQLYEVGRGLAPHMTLVGIDLDQSGIAESRVTAFDLIYVIAVATLGHLEANAGRNQLFEELSEAYAGPEKSALGTVEQALGGVVGLGEAVVAAATAFALAGIPVTLAVASIKVVKNALLLRTASAGVVSATSPQGRQLQAAAERIFDAVRTAYKGRPIAVLLDGLERVNGAAAQWMRNVFENTRLLTDTSVTMVVATPPCPFTTPNAVTQVGWTTQVAWGFAPDDEDTLYGALRKRAEVAGLPSSAELRESLRRFVEASGGHPRHAVLLLNRAANSALRAKRGSIAIADVEAAIEAFRDELMVGVDEDGYEALLHVQETGRLPSTDIATLLFVTGRILVHPRSGARPLTFHPHPLIKPWIVDYARERAERSAGEPANKSS